MTKLIAGFMTLNLAFSPVTSLQVAPRQVADTMWYFPLLQPYVDHVPVKADLSDLEEKIRWCRQNDDKCREIGENAKIFYEKYVSR